MWWGQSPLCLHPPVPTALKQEIHSCIDKFHWCCQILGCNGQRMCKLYTAVAGDVYRKKWYKEFNFNYILLKVRKSRKQFMVSSIVLKRRTKKTPKIWPTGPQVNFFFVFRSLFGKIEGTIICFWDFLTFIFGWKVINRTFFWGWDQDEK